MGNTIKNVSLVSNTDLLNFMFDKNLEMLDFLKILEFFDFFEIL